MDHCKDVSMFTLGASNDPEADWSKVYANSPIIFSAIWTATSWTSVTDCLSHLLRELEEDGMRGARSTSGAIIHPRPGVIVYVRETRSDPGPSSGTNNDALDCGYHRYIASCIPGILKMHYCSPTLGNFGYYTDLDISMVYYCVL